MTIRLISWNLNKRLAIDGQIAALAEHQPDLVALQEVKAMHLPALGDLFAEIGLPYVIDSHTSAEISHRGYIVLASRWPSKLKSIRRLPCPESSLSASLKTPYGMIEMHAVHVPTITNPASLKLRFVEELYERLSRPSRYHRILCGDFNFPQRELADGTVITFSEKIRADGTFYVQRGKEQHAEAEQRIMTGLVQFDLHDVYRRVNGFTPHDSSWVARNRGRDFGYRLDHILASQSLKPIECFYHHSLRERGLSDHSAIEALFAP